MTIFPLVLIKYKFFKLILYFFFKNIIRTRYYQNSHNYWLILDLDYFMYPTDCGHYNCKWSKFLKYNKFKYLLFSLKKSHQLMLPWVFVHVIIFVSDCLVSILMPFACFPFGSCRFYVFHIIYVNILRCGKLKF